MNIKNILLQLLINKNSAYIQLISKIFMFKNNALNIIMINFKIKIKNLMTYKI